MKYLQSSGRLGNQLFILAFAHFIRDQTGQNVTIFKDKYHSGKFNEAEELALILENCRHGIEYRNDNFRGWLLKVSDKLKNKSIFRSLVWRKILRISQSDTPYDPYEIVDLSKRIFSGYFQNVIKFEKYIDVVVEELTPLLINSAIEPAQKPYQAWHLRRGDLNENHEGVLSIEYYMATFERDLPLIICTDSDNLANELSGRINYLEIYSPKNSTIFETLYLLSCAKKLTIANSTLSWWAGAIARTRDTKVYFPNPWYKKIIIPELNFQLGGFVQIESQFK